MSVHRLFLLALQRGTGAAVLDALRDGGHPCDAETERRVLQGDVAQGVVVAQSGDLAALRALQERLVALGCGAFVSESSSWRASVWESLRALLDFGEGAGTKARAALGTVVLLVVLLAVAAGLASLAGRDRRTNDGSPFDTLTETRAGARTPREEHASTEGPTAEHTRRAGASGEVGAGGDDHEPDGDLTTTLVELGASLGGLIVAVGLGALALRVRGVPARRFMRATQAVGVVLLGVGLWAGTRPREVEQGARTSADDTGGELLVVTGDGTIDGLDGGTEDYNDDAGEGDLSDDAVARRRELRGPFDRFLQRLSGRLPRGAAPRYASLLESLRASAPPSPSAANAPALATNAPELPGASERASGRHHRGERRARHGHRRGSDRHAEVASAATTSAADAGLAGVADVSLAAPSVTADASTSPALTVTRLSDPDRTPVVRPRPVRRSSARTATPRPGVGPLGARRELPRLGPWCLVGFALGVVIAARPRSKEVAS